MRRRKTLETIRGAQLRPGDVVDLALGPTLVLRTKDEHGGVTWTGVPAKGGPPRTLFHWANDPLRVLRRDPKALERALREAEAKREAA